MYVFPVFKVPEMLIYVVNRVHWLRARAQQQRWGEEVVLVRYEMQWTVRSFIHKMEQWDGRAVGVKEAGAVAYAARQSAVWRALAQNANRSFAAANSSYRSIAI